MASLAEDLKVSLFETLSDARRVVNQARQTVGNPLNQRLQSDLATLDRILGQLDADETKLRTSAVSEVPYFGGDIIKRASDAREKAYQTVDEMRLTGPVEFVTKTTEQLGKGVGETIAAALKPLIPILAGLAGFVVIGAILYLVAQRQKT
jgi:hypothetical protein